MFFDKAAILSILEQLQKYLMGPYVTVQTSTQFDKSKRFLRFFLFYLFKDLFDEIRRPFFRASPWLSILPSGSHVLMALSPAGSFTFYQIY